MTQQINTKDGKLYFFFDEIQLVQDWERVINGLRVDLDCDIYITGSNSRLLSSELATLLAGRYVEFEVQAFSFSEFKELYRHLHLSDQQLFEKYLVIGGLPFLKHFDLDEEASHKYLRDVYNTVVMKDVLEANKIRDVKLFNRILHYAIENISHTFSANRLSQLLKNEHIKISVDSVISYLQYCKNAYILKQVSRYNLLGKQVLKIDEKYFVADHGLRQALGYSNIKDIERTLENIVYNELISRGYKVWIGKVNNQEIDFVAQ